MVQFIHLIRILHAVAYIILNFEGIRSDILSDHRNKILDDNGIGLGINIGQTQCQLAILEKEEFATTVGGTHEEIVERLIVLHQIRLDELRRNRTRLGFAANCHGHGLIIYQMLQGYGGLDQRQLTIRALAKLHTLGFQNARSELFGNIGLAVLIERHQFVHTEDVQFHIHRHTGGTTLQLWVQLIHIAILGDGKRLITNSDLQLHLSLQQQG